MGQDIFFYMLKECKQESNKHIFFYYVLNMLYDFFLCV